MGGDDVLQLILAVLKKHKREHGHRNRNDDGQVETDLEFETFCSHAGHS
jgi:hypothetical protein